MSLPEGEYILLMGEINELHKVRESMKDIKTVNTSVRALRNQFLIQSVLARQHKKNPTPLSLFMITI